MIFREPLKKFSEPEKCHKCIQPYKKLMGQKNKTKQKTDFSACWCWPSLKPIKLISKNSRDDWSRFWIIPARSACFTSLTLSSMDRLQMVQNAAAILQTGSSRMSHITLIGSSLRWIALTYRTTCSVRHQSLFLTHSILIPAVGHLGLRMSACWLFLRFV